MAMETTLASGAGAVVVGELKAGIQTLIAEIETQPFWRAVTSSDTPREVVRRFMAEVYGEIALYQPDVIEATIAVIGQFPRSLPAKKIRAMLVHQADEWDHGEMAARDLHGLGAARPTGLPTTTAFATAAFWRMVAHKRLPFAYLGALYLFEGLTPLVTAAAKPSLVEHGFSSANLEYIEFHSTEDVKHARLVDALIEGVLDAYPDMAPQVLFGFDAFRQVYPLPGWNAAYERALASPAQTRDED
jgi:hypothetical protein